MLGGRRNFPPDPADDPDNLVKYSMINSLLAIIFASFLIGWNLFRPIPLIPNWIGSILMACIIGYASTFSDSRGDLIRFSGHSLTSAMGLLMGIADEVGLRGKASVLIGQMLFFLRGMDKKFKVMQKLQVLIAQLIAKSTVLLYRLVRNLN